MNFGALNGLNVDKPETKTVDMEFAVLVVFMLDVSVDAGGVLTLTVVVVNVEIGGGGGAGLAELIDLEFSV